MRAEIVAIGSELLLGDAVDTNSAFLSARLAEVGIDVHRHVTVGDNDERILAAFEQACRHADAVLVTGGLGPTQDDLTRDVLARLVGVDLVRDEDLVAHITGRFTARGRVMPANNLRQADVPRGSRVLPAQGTAAGLAVEHAGAVVYCMPGVPAEMRAMFDRDVLPELTARAGGQTTVSRLVRTAGMAESDVAERCGDLVERFDTEGDAAGRVTLAFLASKGETRVRVTGKGPDRPTALANVDPVVEEVVERLGVGVVGLDDEGTEHAVARQLRRLGWRLALAESVTGGAVGARLVAVPGASDWLAGGLVVYDAAAKTELAGIPASVLEQHGPVSEATAGALAEGVRTRLATEVGLGVVGVAGPRLQAGVDVGTVCLGVALSGAATATRTVRLPGRGRQALLDFATSSALDYLRRRLAEAA